MDETTPGLVSAQGARSRVSPDRRQKTSYHPPTSFIDSSVTDSAFFPTSTSVSSRSSQRNYIDPSNRDFVAPEMLGSSAQRQYSRQNSGDDIPYGTRNGGFAESGLTLPGRTGSNNISGYNSSVGSRNGSLPPSRSEVESSSRGRGDSQNLQHARYTANATAQRLNSVANAPPFIMHTGPSGPRMGEHNSPTHLEGLASQFDQLSVANQQRRPSYASSQPSPNSITGRFPDAYSQDPQPGAHGAWVSEMNESFDISEQLSPAPSSVGLSRHNQFRSAFNGQYSHSPSDSEARLSHHSPFYSANGTPPTSTQQNALARGNYPGTSTQQAVLLERRLQGLQQQQQGYIPTQTQMQFRNQIPFPYEINPQQFRMNNLNSYYPMTPAPHLLSGPHVPRGPARDHDIAGHLRSPLLEEFRNNSKTNKRYELKVHTTLFSP